MPKKSEKKKKLYLRIMREQAKKGLVNTVDGTFKPYSQMPDNSMRRDYMQGYHFNVS